MGQLESQILDALARVSDSLCSDHRGIMRALLTRKVRQSGHRVTASVRQQIDLIAEAVANRDATDLETKLDSLRGGKRRNGPVLHLKLEKADWDWLQSVIREELAAACATMLRDTVSASWTGVQKDCGAYIEADAQAHMQVERNIDRSWGRALRWCQLLASLCTHVAELVAEEVPSRGLKPKVRQATKVALQHLHARGCLAFREIIYLLRGGFPDAAIARWRLLHELDVFAVLIAEGPPRLASRFLAHERMELHSILSADGEGFDDTPEDRAIDIRRKRELERYGRDFGNPLGWATELVGKRRPQFRDLQALAEKSQYRQTYLLACSAVHASSMGSRRPLGGGGRGQMLVGPSSAGIFHPAASAVRSLVVLSSTLLNVTQSLDCAAAFGLFPKAGQKALRELEACERRRVSRETN